MRFILKTTTIIYFLISASIAMAEDKFVYDDFKKPNLSNNEEIALNGKIIEVNPYSFVLEYDSRTIEVETDDLYQNAEDVFIPGQYVKVKGNVENGAMNQQHIEATRIEKYVNEFDEY